MNHFVGLLILSLVVATVFALINQVETKQRLMYFFRLLLYMIVGSLVFAWLMYFIPW